MKPKTLHSHRLFSSVITCSFLAVAAASAGTVTWTGATSTDFTVATNWNPATAPANDLTTDIATFSGTPTTNQPSVGANRSVNGVAFTSGGWTLGGGSTLSVGVGGILSAGDNTITAPLNTANSGPRAFSTASGTTLTLNNIVSNEPNRFNLTLGSPGNDGTIILGGGGDNPYVSAVVAYGTVVMNKGTLNGTASGGSAIDNATVDSGATLRYGPNFTDRNGTAANGQGQIYGALTLNGTLDLNGKGQISDNYTVTRVTGATATALITNNGTGSGQLRIVNNDGAEYGFDGQIKDGTASTALYFNIAGTERFNNVNNTFSGGVEIARGFVRFSADSVFGAVPATPSINVKMDGANAYLMNNGGVLTMNANRNILVGPLGGGFKAGWNSAFTIPGVISGTGRVIIMGDNGSVVFGGANTYTGNTVLENANSRLTLADDARLSFVVNTNGNSTQITGNSSAKGTLTLNGDFDFNLANAELANGNSWSIIDSAGVNFTHSPTFSVVGFSESNDVWTKVVPAGAGTATYTYTESTGKLTLAVVGPVPNVTLGTYTPSATGGTILLNDVNGGTVNPNGPFTFELLKNGVVVPTTVTVTKTGSVTTVSFSPVLEGNTSYTYSLTFPVTGIPGVTTKTITGSIKSPVLPLSLPGPDGTPGNWGVREVRVTGANTLVLAYAATFNAANLEFTNASVPVLNHHDPESNGAKASGNFNNDLPILSDAAGNQDFVVVGKTKVTIPAAGDYTFSVHSDDGFAMRVSGGAAGSKFISKSGNGQIDPLDNQTLFLDGGTADSSTRGVYHFNAAGTYDILFLNFDGGGGGFYELAWAPGAFIDDKDTNTWTLVGTPANLPPFLPRYAVNFPGPAGTNGNFGVRTYLTTPTVTSLDLANDFLAATTRQPADADNQTLDTQVNVLNANDPEAGGAGGLIIPDTAFPGNTNTPNDNVVTTAKGRITVATAGLYTFSVQADDGYILRFKGVGGLSNPSFKRVSGSGTFEMSNPNELYSNNAGNTRAVVQLAAGSYDVEFVHFENTGDFFYELASTPGEFPGDTTPAQPWTLVGYTVSSTPVIVPKMKAPGWTVVSTIPYVTGGSNPPASYQITATTGTTTIEDYIFDANQTEPSPVGVRTTKTSLSFEDPQNPGSGGNFAHEPFPTNTALADDSFAVKATGTLVITTAGEYRFGFQGDDGGYLTIKGGPGAPPAWKALILKRQANTALVNSEGDANGPLNRVEVTGGAANSRNIVSIDLVPGEYTLEAMYYEVASNAYWEVFGAGASDTISPLLPLLSTTGPTSVVNPSSFPLAAQVVAPVNGPFNIKGFATTGSPISGATFTFDSGNSGTYAVQVSTDLVNWSTLNATITPGASTSTVTANFAGQFVNTNQPIIGQPKLFVRVIRTF